MPTFPQLSSGSVSVRGALANEALAMYPATLGHSFVTRTLTFLGDQEQRWTVRRELFSALLEYHSVNGYDFSILLKFFRDRKGAYVNPSLTNAFDITLAGVNYQYCVFDHDEFEFQSEQGETYSFTLRIKQIRVNDES